MGIDRIDVYARGTGVAELRLASLLLGASPLRIFPPLTLSTKSNAFVADFGEAAEGYSQLTLVDGLSNLRDGRYIGAQDALLRAGGNDGVMPYISKNEGKYTMNNLLKRLWQEEEGQDLVEYGLLVVLIALFAIGAMSGLAKGISTAFSTAAANLSTAT